jgi:predicted DCC family thiol-disulfide oxidoreductase YuxK
MKQNETDTIFYDGHCGLCHWFVRFILAKDSCSAFRFAPLQSPTFEKALPEDKREKLPDSIVLLTRDAKILTYSSAVVYVLKRLGGVWWFWGILLWLVPSLLRNIGYQFIAYIRYKLFTRPQTTCPLIPAHLNDRFIIEA